MAQHRMAVEQSTAALLIVMGVIMGTLADMPHMNSTGSPTTFGALNTTSNTTNSPSTPTLAPTFKLKATISKPFTAELTNQTTTEFQDLASAVVTFCDGIFLETYGFIFITTNVLGFSPSTNGNTTIEVELVFNNKASPEVTFSKADVLETMTTAATNTFAGGISYDPESVVVTETPTSTTAATTTTPTPATSPSVPTTDYFVTETPTSTTAATTTTPTPATASSVPTTEYFVTEPATSTTAATTTTPTPATSPSVPTTDYFVTEMPTSTTAPATTLPTPATSPSVPTTDYLVTGKVKLSIFDPMIKVTALC
ncbi:uncharacterized protein LOC132456141 isoform X2 [Gadus macrocephalus]|uniref:uncharacterized protein LOC132456141 isoform X2 n=1 Tax=Gadus macrocephalus TaxID=80720 RepID=UPI0028CB31C2|nr:uncharacterized protein LOC132456141 isoform X2 [Gadus macrocephalus]